MVYLKEGSQIVDILNVMEAHIALMNLENVRILKEMRNSVNRKVNWRSFLLPDVLVSTKCQHESAISMHMSPPS